MQLRWGIIGTGRIAHDFCLALLTCDPAEHTIVAVSSRKKEQSDKFAKQFGISKSYGSQEEILADQDVDIVYISTIEQVHRDMCIKALNHGKHVLCEKPLAMNSAEAQEIIDVARKTKKFFLEAVWSRFFPIYDDYRQALKQIGQVTLVECTFCVPGLNKNIWSVLMAIGCYPLQAALLAFDHEEPEKIVASGQTKKLDDGQHSDASGQLTLLFKGGNRMAVLTCLGEDIGEVNSLKVHGTKGVISMPTYFWCPERIELPNGHVIEKPLPPTKWETNYAHSAGLRYEAIASRECIMAGKTEHPNMSHDTSLQLARLIEEARRQIIGTQ